MNTAKRATIGSGALSVVKSHLELINDGDLVAARRQLFSPPRVGESPLGIYLNSMRKLTPFQLKSVSIKNIEDVRQKRHGRVATVWVNVVVMCALGEKAADIVVWWFPDSDEYRISGRPSHWISELLIDES